MSLVEGMPPASEGTLDLNLIGQSVVNVMVTSRDDDERMAWARRVHDCGARRRGRFVCVFPVKKRHVRIVDVDEWFARAAGGTLFIDRVGDLSSQAQDRLSHLLAEQSRRTNPLDIRDAPRRIRVVAGSDRSLSTDVATGAFSEELFYRLNVIHIDLAHQYHSGAQAMKAATSCRSEPTHAERLLI